MTFVALLRGINVSGRNVVPMATLRSICADGGCRDVRTYIQSGNVVFTSNLAPTTIESRLEQALQRQVGFSVPVIVRPASSWNRYIRGNPFSAEAEAEGNRVLLSLSKRPPKATAATALQALGTLGERVVTQGDAIWIHYPGGIGRSKITPALLDRHVGSPVTARNWRTVLKLGEMMRGGGNA